MVSHLKNMDRVFYGLTEGDLRSMAWGFAEGNKVAHPFRNNQAGEGWCNGFLKRHPELVLRKPESTSLARASAFNRPQVERFFNLLRSLYLRYDLRPCDVWNVDEKGIQTSANRPPKVISQRGKKQVGVVSSAERGRTVTVLVCCSAARQYIPQR